MADDFAILARGLRKRYANVVALDGFDLAVAPGSVCGLLGPNGAGKTTAIRILATLLRYDEGHAEIAGFDVERQATEVRYRIGLVGQNAAVDEILSGRQNLIMFGRLYHLSARDARHRAGDLLEQFGLLDAADKPLGQYSGGMRRRLDLAAGLILAPPVLFLDEPTTGLDPRSRNQVWDVIRTLVGGGTTVLLTTQYLEEADQLADAISVIDGGRVIAEGSPEQLKSKLGGDRIDVVLHGVEQLSAAAGIVERIVGTPPELNLDTRRVSVAVSDQFRTLAQVVRALDDSGIDAEDIALRRPTLDEVFLHLTGQDRQTSDDPIAQLAEP